MSKIIPSVYSMACDTETHRIVWVSNLSSVPYSCWEVSAYNRKKARDKVSNL